MPKSPNYTMKYPIAPVTEWTQTDAAVQFNVWIPSLEVGDFEEMGGCECVLTSAFLRVRVEAYLVEVDFHDDVHIDECTLELLPVLDRHLLFHFAGGHARAQHILLCLCLCMCACVCVLCVCVCVCVCVCERERERETEREGEREAEREKDNDCGKLILYI